MSVCVYVCAFVCVYVSEYYGCLYLVVWVYVCGCMCVCVCVYLCLCVRICARSRIRVRAYYRSLNAPCKLDVGGTSEVQTPGSLKDEDVARFASKSDLFGGSKVDVPSEGVHARG
jgi:hypothetical protein